jgi:hypothetical protein
VRSVATPRVSNHEAGIAEADTEFGKNACG